MGKTKRTLSVILAALMLVFTCMTYIPASAAEVLPQVKFVGLQNIPAAVGEDQTLMLTSNYTGNVQYQVFYIQRNDPTKKVVDGWKQVGSGWTTAADAKVPVEVKVPAGTITVAGNYSFAIRVKRAGVDGANANTYGSYDSAYAFNYVFAATATAGLKDAKLASAEVSVGENFVISGLTAGNSYRLFTLNEARAQRWDSAAVAVSTTDTLNWMPTVAGNYVLDLQLVDESGKVTAVKLFNVVVNDNFKVLSAKAISAKQIEVKFNKDVNKTEAAKAPYYSVANYTLTPTVVDSKTVILGTDKPITGTNLYVVNPIPSDADANVKTPIFTYVETYSDTVAPAVEKIEYPTYDKAVVTFTEPLSAPGNITATQDGAALSLRTPVLSGKTLTFDLTTDTNSVVIAKDKPITVVIVGATDCANNLINPNPTTITLTKVQSDTTKPTVVSVTALSDTRVAVTFSEKLSANPTVVVGTSAVTFPTYDSTKDNLTFTGTFTTTPGIQVVKVSAYTDMSSNTGDDYSVLRQFTADSTKPVLASSEVQVINGIQYLVLHFNEDVDPTLGGADITGTRVMDYISYSFTKTAVVPVAYVNGTTTDTKSVMIDISNATNWPEGAYSVTVKAGIVQDESTAKNLNADTAITFTKGAYTATDTTAPTVKTGTGDALVFSTNNDYLTVKFSELMDYATALNVNNYKVGGACIFSSAIFDGSADVVKLAVIPGTIVYGGTYALNISGVKDKAGNVMTAYTNPITLAENVKPYIVSAKLKDASTITVTFSENVDILSAGAFEVYVNGEKQATSTVTPTNNVKSIDVTITPITDLSKTIQVKLVDTNTVDQSENYAITGTLVTVAQ